MLIRLEASRWCSSQKQELFHIVLSPQVLQAVESPCLKDIIHRQWFSQKSFAVFFFIPLMQFDQRRRTAQPKTKEQEICPLAMLINHLDVTTKNKAEHQRALHVRITDWHFWRQSLSSLISHGSLLSRWATRFEPRRNTQVDVYYFCNTCLVQAGMTAD